VNHPQKCGAVIVSLLLLAGSFAGKPSTGQHSTARGEWPSYAGDAGSTKYSPLAQINQSNVGKLRVAWQWDSIDNRIEQELAAKKLNHQRRGNRTTPLMIGGVLYLRTDYSLVVALDAATGKQLWVFDPETTKNANVKFGSYGFIARGLGFWSSGKEERLLLATADAYLIALDLKTGKPIPSFGKDGRVDIYQFQRRPRGREYHNYNSPPVVCGDVVAVSSSMYEMPLSGREMPPGDVIGFDVRTGKHLWSFHVIPEKGEYGYETWEDGAADWNGNANVWAPMSADEELGYLYAPLTCPTNNAFGGLRKGDNLFGNSLVCLDARTGRRVWHFQTTHHDLWDYDLPAAPVLCDITVNGKKIKAIAQVSKQGFCYVFDRVTGKPVWPIEERAVPQTTLGALGEKTSATQPIPTKPPAFERQGITEDDLIDFTPKLRADALTFLKQFNYGPLYTPASEQGTLFLPGIGGGANWGGASFDPETGMLYVPSHTLYTLFGLTQDATGRSAFGVRQSRTDKGLFPAPPNGLPIFKPPYGRITAYDLNKGDIRWQVAHGDGPRNHPLLKDLKLPPLGNGGHSAVLLTKTLLFAAERGSAFDNSGVDLASRQLSAGGEDTASRRRQRVSKLRAFDKATGAVLWEFVLEPSYQAGALPMTYSIGGKQYVVIATGAEGDPGGLTAFALP
jgi:quinoprotein glucose dehydrogenase